MDNNKLKVLQDINYTVKRVCGNCSHFQSSHAGADFGICHDKRYNHLKHSESERNLSVHTHGTCADHQWRKGSIARMHRFVELREK